MLERTKLKGVLINFAKKNELVRIKKSRVKMTKKIKKDLENLIGNGFSYDQFFLFKI